MSRIKECAAVSTLVTSYCKIHSSNSQHFDVFVIGNYAVIRGVLQHRASKKTFFLLCECLDSVDETAVKLMVAILSAQALPVAGQFREEDLHDNAVPCRAVQSPNPRRGRSKVDSSDVAAFRSLRCTIHVRSPYTTKRKSFLFQN